jgi:hypothetical protein
MGQGLWRKGAIDRYNRIEARVGQQQKSKNNQTGGRGGGGKDCAGVYANGAWGQKTSYGKTITGVIRSTVIIAGNGTVVKHYKAVKAKGHVERELMEYLSHE